MAVKYSKMTEFFGVAGGIMVLAMLVTFIYMIWGDPLLGIKILGTELILCGIACLLYEAGKSVDEKHTKDNE